jgi:hypothetical protein
MKRKQDKRSLTWEQRLKEAARRGEFTADDIARAFELGDDEFEEAVRNDDIARARAIMKRRATEQGR